MGKNKKFDVDNANYEIKILKALNMQKDNEPVDKEGLERIVEYCDSFNFRQHVVIVFEYLH